MRVAAFMEIRFVYGKVLWFPVGTISGVTEVEVDDEDMEDMDYYVGASRNM